MVVTLGDLLVAFPGDTNQTRCFDHIINLIAKSIIKQFDISKTAQKDSLDHDKKHQVLMVVTILTGRTLDSAVMTMRAEK
jgi:hypothetical protein